MNWTVAAAAGVGGFGGAAIRSAVRVVLDWRQNRRELAHLRARLEEALAHPARWNTTVIPDDGKPCPDCWHAYQAWRIQTMPQANIFGGMIDDREHGDAQVFAMFHPHHDPARLDRNGDLVSRETGCRTETLHASPMPPSQPGDHMAKPARDDRWTSAEQEPPT